MRIQQSGCSQALANVPFTPNTNFGERSLALAALLNMPLVYERDIYE